MTDFKALLTAKQGAVTLEKEYWDYGIVIDNKKIVDHMLHHSCFTLGYNQPRIVDAVSNVVRNIKPEIAETLTPGQPLYVNNVTLQLAEKLYNITGGYRSFFSLSGSDANEGAVKLASAYHYLKGNKNKKYIVSLRKSFHGSTFLSQSIGCENLMINPFYTMDRYHGVKHVNRNFKIEDTDWSEVSCFVVETCNYGGRMDPFTDDFWARLQTLQQEHNVLIVIDDVFFSGGKTGNYVGWKHLPIEPDIFTIGKAITGGFFPLSAFLYNDKVHQALPDNFYWDHGFTYNYSISGIVSALEYLKIADEQNLFTNVPNIIERATKTFKESGYLILNNFGTVFVIAHAKRGSTMYVVPINATDEYFEVLKENLTS